MKLGFYIFLLLTIVSCRKEDHVGCFVSTGKVTTEMRSLGNYTEIKLYDNINISLVKGNQNTAEITAGENLILGIHTKIENGILIISNENTCNFMRTYKIPVNVKITYDSLRGLTHYGGGKVSTPDTLKQSFLEFQQWFGSGDFELLVNIDTLKLGFHTGSGNADVFGKTKELSLYSAGNSIFRCQNLIANKVYINQSSTGDFTVNVLNELYVQIYNYGDVFYYGNPILIEQQIYNSGKLIHLP